jgi:hypothetical protein
LYLITLFMILQYNSTIWNNITNTQM